MTLPTPPASIRRNPRALIAFFTDAIVTRANRGEVTTALLTQEFMRARDAFYSAAPDSGVRAWAQIYGTALDAALTVTAERN